MSVVSSIGNRRVRKTIPLLLATLVILTFGFSAIWIQAASATMGSWSSTTNYPTNVLDQNQGCVVDTGFVYCIGGNAPSAFSCCGTNTVNFAPLSSGGGIGAWVSTTSYPTSIVGQSCVVSSGFVYCIAGQPCACSSIPSTDAVYFAPLSPSGGVGLWLPTTSYPTTIVDESCVVSSGFVYCIGGGNTITSGPTNAVYYAALSSGGVGLWTPTTNYPTTIFLHSCVTSSGFVYCIGGYGPPYENTVYFAPLSSSGVGPWTITTSYPIHFAYNSCVAISMVAYCVGGLDSSGGSSGQGPTDAVYSAPLSSSGVGTWSSATNYPTAIYRHICVASSGFAYCIGGASAPPCCPPTNAIYFAPIKDTTSTSVSCASNKVVDSHATTCTATVTDTSSGTKITPKGTVSWTCSPAADCISSPFRPSNSCTLSTTATGPTNSCSVTFGSGPGKPNTVTIGALYTGDSDHFGSSGSTTIIASS